ncbi:hypothetical protein [Azospirillum sp. SYSU D00513]|uniref:hypothetical protein n=1 Tax=Azospirillum sp. SYSU D00513 TaxID=2812561 RepID=UPI001A975C54|nr:hypothetical protein [Azospirillum sp. SYSU D00513]
MSAQELLRLLKDAEANPILKATITKELSQVNDASSASAALKALGYDVSADEIQAANTGVFELRDDALDRVVGGAPTARFNSISTFDPTQRRYT